MNISFDRLMLILEYGDDEFEEVEEEIVHQKHSETTSRLIVKRGAEGAEEFFELFYSRDYNEGLRDYGDIELTPVEKTTKISYKRIKQ